MTGQGFQDLGLQAANGGCACCGPTSDETGVQTATRLSLGPAATEMSAQFLVEGMTCSHCVRSVTEEVSAIEGVTGVQVDLHAGGVSTVTVSSTVPVEAERVREAVEEAGYSLAGAS